MIGQNLSSDTKNRNSPLIGAIDDAVNYYLAVFIDLYGEAGLMCPGICLAVSIT